MSLYAYLPLCAFPLQKLFVGIIKEADCSVLGSYSVVLALRFSFPTTFVYSVEVNLANSSIPRRRHHDVFKKQLEINGLIKNGYLEEYLSIFMYLIAFHELFGNNNTS